MIYIPPGEFIMGTTEEDTNSLGKEYGTREERFFENAKPVRKLFLKGFHIDTYELTIGEYKRYLLETGEVPPPNWAEGGAIGRDNHPVNAVNWFSADAYCRWAGKRLPTEEEWEKAARGPKGNIYPWGNLYDPKKANLDMQDTVPVGSMPEDRSFYGVHDMGGNLSEWTSSWYKGYPGSTLKSKYFGEVYKIVRGATGSVVGHYNLTVFDAMSSFRIFYRPSGLGVDVGFRCAKDK